MEPEDTSPVGMAGIAAAAGVSVSTVSRALSGVPGVSTAKRAEIRRIARAQGYLADDIGREQNRDARTAGRITAVIPEPDRWVFGSILAGLHDVLTPTGATLTVYQGLSGRERAKLFEATALSRSSDVVVLVPMPHRMPVPDVRRLGVPVVVAGSVVEGIASVGIDDVVVGQQATNSLINGGCTRIVYASSTDHEGTPGNASRRRAEGFESRMQRAGLDPSWQVQVPFGPTAGQVAAEQLLAGERLPDAVFASSDDLASGMLSAFRKAGVRIPQDLSIIGVDDSPIASLMHLTTIAQPARQQGHLAASMALRALQGDPPSEAVTLETRLVIRESTGHPTAR
ncbi:LacI family DNA-binding transcriptional regulator [Pseudoclavibacter terrae]|uniref:LacI family DNA-binding transcriptional regulator n=1 Tax=Pseudoclavibacter terrae TaxID=1530195 RepID=UPI00232BBC20|nr:LacI family DNA-binding transcriptional regulator [Pseudoclavibacter terrae]